MTQLTVSMELLNPKAKRPLGTRIEAIVAKWIDRRNTEFFYSSEDLTELSKIVKEETGMEVDFGIIHSPIPSAAANVINIPGHQGSGYTGTSTQPATVAGKSAPKELLKLKIDLDKGSVSQTVFTGLRNRITITTGLIQNTTLGMDTEEITYIIIHELGHCFNQYLTLGEYAWLNYILQDGLEVLQGKKPNVYRLEVLTEKGIERYCKDKDLIKTIRTTPTEANLRRAILSAHANAPRHHLASNNRGQSLIREEQLADLYASRMGYSRAGVSALIKLSKVLGNRYTKSNTSFAFGETVKVLSSLSSSILAVGGFVYPPAWIGAIIFISLAASFSYNDTSQWYDNPLERMTKFRRDLVAQLKVLGKDLDLERQILDDIAAVDKLLAQCRQHTTVWEAATTFLSPSIRKQRHQRSKEEQLERLLNNDLFVTAAKLNHRIRNT